MSEKMKAPDGITDDAKALINNKREAKERHFKMLNANEYIVSDEKGYREYDIDKEGKASFRYGVSPFEQLGQIAEDLYYFGESPKYCGGIKDNSPTYNPDISGLEELDIDILVRDTISKLEGKSLNFYEEFISKLCVKIKDSLKI